MARRLRRVLILALVTAAAILGPGVGTARAHPFGDPQTVAITLVAPTVVEVHWKVGMADDLSYLDADLGLLPPDRLLLDGAVTPESSDPALLQGSPVFDAYLTDHIKVTADEQACAGEASDTGDVLTDGAIVEFTCPQPVTAATVTVSMLTDMSDLYTTLATGPQGQRSVYDGSHTSHRWRFDPSAVEATSAGGSTDASTNAGRSAALQLGLAGGVVAAGAALITFAVRRRKSRLRAVPPLHAPVEKEDA